MKIVHLVLTSGADFTDGYGYQENTLPEVQAMLGNEVTLITSTFSSLLGRKREKMEGEYYINHVKIIRIAPTYTILSNRFAVFSNLFAVLEKEKPDLIFSHGMLLFSVNQLKKYKITHSDVLIFFDCHCTYVNSIRKYPILNKYLLHRGLWRLLFKAYRDVYDKGYYVAPQVKRFVMEMYDVDEKKLDYLPMGVYIPEDVYSNRDFIGKEWRKEHNIFESDIVLIVGGRFREEKKLYEVVRAFTLLNMENIKLVIFGRFEDKDYENRVKALFNNNILFIGWLNNEQIRDAYFAADLALLTGTQSVIWRAAVGCGLPVICRYSDGIDELNIGGNCIFMDTDDPCLWAKRIKEVLVSSSLLFNMKNVAETKGYEFFSEVRIAKKIIDDCKKV